MENDYRRIIIEGVDIPFVDLVILLVKLAFASIPAIIIVSGIFSLLSVLFGGIFNMFMFRI